ncbi:hypothetical protein F5Y08DRAFT_106622 [Xylaria arbuscula]|nr:hypothetical protein F5Y08DRAFT_106622 [Xylaria arbuscula]
MLCIPPSPPLLLLLIHRHLFLLICAQTTTDWSRISFRDRKHALPINPQAMAMRRERVQQRKINNFFAPSPEESILEILLSWWSVKDRILWVIIRFRSPMCDKHKQQEETYKRGFGGINLA